MKTMSARRAPGRIGRSTLNLRPRACNRWRRAISGAVSRCLAACILLRASGDDAGGLEVMLVFEISQVVLLWPSRLLAVWRRRRLSSKLVAQRSRLRLQELRVWLRQI